MIFTPKMLKNLAASLRGSKLPDPVVLRTLHHFSAETLGDLHDRVQERIRTNHWVHDCTERGRVAVVVEGLDCDCAAYTGLVHYVKSDLCEFWNFIDRLYDSAEGPIHWRIVKPSEAINIEQRTRDLGFEAFEGGHAYQVSYSL